MKKLFALLLSLVMCFGACALAEDDVWVDYSALIMGMMYESADEVVESDASRVVAMASAVLDYAVAEPTAYAIGSGDTYYVMSDDGLALFLCPLMENSDGMLSALLVYDFTNQQYSMRPVELPVYDLMEALADVADATYTLNNQDVAEAAELLLDAILSE